MKFFVKSAQYFKLPDVISTPAGRGAQPTAKGSHHMEPAWQNSCFDIMSMFLSWISCMTCNKLIVDSYLFNWMALANRPMLSISEFKWRVLLQIIALQAWSTGTRFLFTWPSIGSGKTGLPFLSAWQDGSQSECLTRTHRIPQNVVRSSGGISMYNVPDYHSKSTPVALSSLVAMWTFCSCAKVPLIVFQHEDFNLVGTYRVPS